MIDVWVGFGGVVGKVGGAWTPVVAELALGFAAAEPPKAHVHGLHFLSYECFVGYAQGCGVVCLDGGLGLRPTHLDEGLAERDHFFGTDEEGGKFRFGSG